MQRQGYPTDVWLTGDAICTAALYSITVTAKPNNTVSLKPDCSSGDVRVTCQLLPGSSALVTGGFDCRSVVVDVQQVCCLAEEGPADKL